MDCFESKRLRAVIASNRMVTLSQRIDDNTREDKIVVNTKVELDIKCWTIDVWFEV